MAIIQDSVTLCSPKVPKDPIICGVCTGVLAARAFREIYIRVARGVIIIGALRVQVVGTSVEDSSSISPYPGGVYDHY